MRGGGGYALSFAAFNDRFWPHSDGLVSTVAMRG